MQGAITFLATRVKCPDKDNYKNWARAIRYLQGTKELVMPLVADSTHIIKWWIDVSFTIHKNMERQIGAMMAMGRGPSCSTSTRQRINTKSFREAKQIGADNVMPMILWPKYFLEAQGFKIRDSKIYQDNQRASLLEKNGKASICKRTRYIC